MELYEILGSLEFILSFMAMLLSSFVFWKTSLAGLRTSKLLQGFNLVRVLKRTDTELALLGDFNDDKIKEKAALIIQTAAMDTGALDQLLAGLRCTRSWLTTSTARFRVMFHVILSRTR
ncbi:hypothetical protein DVH05_013817 [Phytophthora capsici]|nr:hypothetical protein DVH05_013817 [Phytophthora capsici]